MFKTRKIKGFLLCFTPRWISSAYFWGSFH